MGSKRMALLIALAGIMTCSSAVMADSDVKYPYQYYNYGVHAYPQYGSYYGYQTGPDIEYFERNGYGYDQGYASALYNTSSVWYSGYLDTYHNHSYKHHPADPPANPASYKGYFRGEHRQ